MSLLEDLRGLPEPTKKLLADRGFDPALLARLAENHLGGHSNRIEAIVAPPEPSDLQILPPLGSAESQRLTALGEPFFKKGQIALVVMAGGMATRMGGVVKVLVEVFGGKTFLDLRLAEQRSFAEKYGARVPLWLMTSAPTDGPIRTALQKAGAPPDVATFEQGLALRLDETGRLFKDAAGDPSFCATGHGDLVDALRRSGFLAEFVAAGGKYVVIANVDNLGATPDPAIVGALVASGKKVLVEVCKKAPGDRGGIPVRVEGKAQILEEFRLPEGFDPASVDVFNTNTFVVEARALLEAEIDWTWFSVSKKVDGKSVLQFERLVQEIAAVLPSMFLTVPREGDDPRFLPVKDPDELLLRRATIEKLAERRGWIGGEGNR